MKKLIIIGLILGSIGCTSYASNYASDEKSGWGSNNWNNKSAWAGGQSRFVAELNLDADRAAKMEAILDSYREVPKMYFTNQSEKIPEFLAQKDAELAALLTPEEFAQFKHSFDEWAKKKNFKFMKFSQYQSPAIQAIEFQVPDALRQQIRENLDSQLIEAGRQLREQTLNV